MQAPKAADSCNMARPSGSVPKEPRCQFHQRWRSGGGETKQSLVVLALGSLARQIAQYARTKQPNAARDLDVESREQV